MKLSDFMINTEEEYEVYYLEETPWRVIHSESPLPLVSYSRQLVNGVTNWDEAKSISLDLDKN